MALRTRGHGPLTAAVTVALLAVASGTEAAAAEWRPRPGMVYLSDMPKDGTTWYGAPAVRGWNSLTACFGFWPGDQAPEVNVWSREVATSETAAGVQNTMVFETEAEAIAFAARARQAYADCPRAYEGPHSVVTAYDYGTVDVEEGAAVLGMREEAAGDSGVYHNHLFGVGRDGDTVTLIEWQSNWSAPPVDYFKNTTVKNVVNRLY
ncbi:hypothetical protein [Streptomyces roseolus]|uniref:hypothetical protein n=1 Tax=Streptomyces roseolus TaxID=67358 RepID=UPI0016784525|nr:hypothetical protein [Streptomyces roseolus]GGR62243.1 hypothetical protein GCM10010282_64280 [Streptomyces roseolus]